ncbi:hypothetical protein HY085_01435 [Candidatus Gottesmanbacteria bacterium]|nr:hypothetical protein [Candidatus Gottesmanbacteria bacterium]
MKKKIPGEKRLEVAIRLSAIVRELAIAGIKKQYPQANNTQVQNLWVKEISLPY